MTEELVENRIIITTPEGELNYKHKDALLKTLNAERGSWEFLETLDLSKLPQKLASLNRYFKFTNSINNLDHLIGHISNMVVDGKTIINIPNYHSDFGQIPAFSKSSEGSIALMLLAKGDLEAALMIHLGVLFGRSPKAQILNNVRDKVPGIVEQCLASSSSARLHDRIAIDTSTKTKIKTAIESISMATSEAEATLEKSQNQLSESNNKLKAMLHSQAVTIKRKISFSNRLIKKGVKQGQDLRDRFLVQMRYRAPVELWEKRAKHHQENAEKALKHFYIFSSIFCIIIVYTAYQHGTSIAELFIPPTCNPNIPETCKGIAIRGILLIGCSTIITSIFLWVLRFKMKVHLSERHLALDAQERKAFAETFLALKEDKSVGAEQEIIVLQSLFRPTQDGIIKDDMTVDASPAGLLSRILSNN